MRDEISLDDPAAMLDKDSGELLRATATAGAQVRTALLRVGAGVLAEIAADGPPRALVILGTGGSGMCADILAALARGSSPVPVVSVCGPTLPGWVGPLDVVIGISTSGQTRETLAATEVAMRRGARVVGIGGADPSPAKAGLAGLLTRGTGWHLATADPHRLARVSLWSLLTPLLLVADALGVFRAPRPALEQLADRLDERALAFGPVVSTLDNPAKETALSIAETLPVIIGTTPLTAAVAKRLAGQLGANARVPAFAAVAPEAISTYGALLDGPYARPADVFRDPFDDPEQVARLSFVLVRGGPENDVTEAQGSALETVAESRGVTVRRIESRAVGDLLVLADLIPMVDFTSVYVALARGEDPWASPAVPELRARVADAL